MTLKEKAKTVHLQCSMGVDMVIKSSLARKTLDNVTCVIVAFENMEKLFVNNTNSRILEINDTDIPIKNYQPQSTKHSRSKHLEENIIYHNGLNNQENIISNPSQTPTNSMKNKSQNNRKMYNSDIPKYNSYTANNLANQSNKIKESLIKSQEDSYSLYMKSKEGILGKNKI